MTWTLCSATKENVRSIIWLGAILLAMSAPRSYGSDDDVVPYWISLVKTELSLRTSGVSVYFTGRNREPGPGGQNGTFPHFFTHTETIDSPY